MPFTPYHFGPALVAKSIFSKQFSITSFAISQLIIDLESLYFLLQQDGPVHRFLHTYLGATLVILLTIILTKLTFKILEKKITWSAIVFASIFGAYSHIFLDSIMHHDIKPFYPFSESNHLLKIIDIPLLHKLCIYSGIIGLCIMLWNLLLKKVSALKTSPKAS